MASLQNKNAGERIRASEWNAVVAELRRLAEENQRLRTLAAKIDRLPILLRCIVTECTTPPGTLAAAEDVRVFAIAGGTMSLEAPAGWKRVQPKSGIVETEFAIPSAGEGAPAGRMTVMGAGGGVQANVDRWYGQFSQPDGSATKDKATTKTLKLAGCSVTLAFCRTTLVPRRSVMLRMVITGNSIQGPVWAASGSGPSAGRSGQVGGLDQQHLVVTQAGGQARIAGVLPIRVPLGLVADLQAHPHRLAGHSTLRRVGQQLGAHLRRGDHRI